MTTPSRPSLNAARALVRELRELETAKAPETLLPRVLSELPFRDSYAAIDTPLGVVFVAFNGHGISAIMQEASSDAFEHVFRARIGRTVTAVDELPASLARSLAAQLQGERHSDLTYDLRGLSEFERAVLGKSLEIPYGEVRPYSWIAREIGRPRAVRAVGSALARNPIPLLIPCHRVVAADGHIGNYGLGGSTAKRTMLQAEGVVVDDLEQLARTGVRYLGSNTTHIYCYPTCGHARRIRDEHRVPFRGDAEAAAAGYRPCKVCRPGSVPAAVAS